MTHDSRLQRYLFLAAASGCLFGLVNSWANAVGRTFIEYPSPPQGLVIKLIGSVLGTEWCWCFVAYLVGRRGVLPAAGAAGGAAALVAAVLAYYLSDAIVGADAGFSGGEAVIWGVTALFAGPAMGVLGALSAPTRKQWFLLASLGSFALIFLAVATVRVSVLALGHWPLVTALAITVAFMVRQLFVRRRQLSATDSPH